MVFMVMMAESRFEFGYFIFYHQESKVGTSIYDKSKTWDIRSYYATEQ